MSSYSLGPGTLPGNIENFVGVAQVPIGLAGPLLVAGVLMVMVGLQLSLFGLLAELVVHARQQTRHRSTA